MGFKVSVSNISEETGRPGVQGGPGGQGSQAGGQGGHGKGSRDAFLYPNQNLTSSTDGIYLGSTSSSRETSPWGPRQPGRQGFLVLENLRLGV